MHKLKNFELKKYFGVLLLTVFLALTTLVNYLPWYKTAAHAASLTTSNYRDIVTDDMIDQARFYTKDTSYPDDNPDDWDMIEEKDSDVINKENIVYGIVNLHNEHFSATELKTSNPGSPSGQTDKDSTDEYYMDLMINSHNGAGKMGFESNTFKLEADSYYMISVQMLTKDSAQASIYIDGLEEDDSLEDSYFELVNTQGLWETYYFYIDTDTAQSDISIELWLGSRTNTSAGALFVHEVAIYRYSEDYYTTITNSEISHRQEQGYVSKSNIISYSPEQNLSPVLNSSFENNTSLSTTWRLTKASNNNSLLQNHSIVQIANNGVLSNCSPNNNFVLSMYNANSSCYQTLQSSNITIAPRQYYKISLWAWSPEETTVAYATLVDTTANVDDEDKIESANIKVSDFSTNNKYRNNWKECVFYVYGDATETKTIAIELSLGLPTESAAGQIYFDDIRMQEITSEYYEDNNGGDNSSNLLFSEDDKTKFLIANSLFNIANTEKDNPIYQPAGWTYTTTGYTNNTIAPHGIINTDAADFDANKEYYGGADAKLVNPGATPLSKSNNNVLMMGNRAENISQTFTSSEISLSSNTCFRISFYIYTNYDKHTTTEDTGARVCLVDTDGNTIFDHFNMDHNNDGWHLYEFYLRIGETAINANLSLHLENVYGYVFFDNIICEQLSDDDDKVNVFDNHYTHNNNSTEISLNLGTESFETGIYGKEYTFVNNSKWTGASANNTLPTHAGILNTQSANIANELVNVDVPTPDNGSHLLYINSLHNVYYTFTSAKSYTFSAKTYYKISVLIHTDNIAYDEEFVDNLYTAKIGASIRLTNSKDIVLEGINTNGQDGFVEYCIYLCLETELSSTIDLSLGCSDIMTKGSVYFDTLTVTSLSDETAYTAEVEGKDTALYSHYINYKPDDSTNDDSEDKDEFVNNFNWLTIPSIITALAILIAVLGFYIKKINIKVTPKIKTTYDRRKTLDKSIDRKEKIALRKQIIEELNKELADIDKELEEFKALSNQKIEELKEKVNAEKESINKHKFELEIRRKEYIASREKNLKANPELIKDKKAEKEFTQYIAKLDKQEIQLQRSLISKESIVEQEIAKQDTYIQSFIERQQIIKDEIVKIEEEIAQIQREEEIMWDEYSEAKKKVKAKAIQDKSNKKK